MAESDKKADEIARRIRGTHVLLERGDFLLLCGLAGHIKAMKSEVMDIDDRAERINEGDIIKNTETIFPHTVPVQILEKLFDSMLEDAVRKNPDKKITAKIEVKYTVMIKVDGKEPTMASTTEGGTVVKEVENLEEISGLGALFG